MCIWTTVLDKDPKVNIVEKGQPFKQMVLQQLDITLKKKKKTWMHTSKYIQK